MLETKEQHLKEAKKHTIMFAVYFAVVLATLCLGSLLFFYIEHCYDIVQPTLNANDKALHTICHFLEESNNKTEKENSTTVGHIQKICTEIELTHEKIECVMNIHTFCKWFDFTTSVSFTTGMTTQFLALHAFFCMKVKSF